MSDIDESSASGPESLRRRAARRLLGTATTLVSRARDTAEALAEAGAARAAAIADVLLMESQQAAYTQLHKRFVERAGHGQAGLPSALDALDAMWSTIRQLRGGAGAVLATLANADHTVQDRRSRFYVESTWLLEDAIRAVFATDLHDLAVPPERMAVLLRVAMEGLVVELAQARTAEDVAVVDQAYLDLRTLFERFVLHGEPAAPPDLVLEPIPLPW